MRHIRTIRRFAFLPTQVIGRLIWFRFYFEDQIWEYKRTTGNAGKWRTSRRYVK